MSISSFSSLIYRIIGKPEHWHDEYIVEMMQQYLDEADAFDDPDNLMDLAAGDQIISALKQGNVALTAFNTLLDKSRFQMIILDEQLSAVYHNRNADALFAYLKDSNDANGLKPQLMRLIRKATQVDEKNLQNALLALDHYDEHGEQIYLRSIQSQVKEYTRPTLFHILMVLDKDNAHQSLNPELVIRYGFTQKEQNVIVRLIHGNTIKEVAEGSFVSENTIKTHLKSIFSKTGSHSQAGLVSKILTHEAQVLDSYFESDISTSRTEFSQENDREIQLRSGEKIAYCEYGPKDGRPLIVFHSAFGSRLAVPPNHAEILKRNNRRLIIPDRPGTGKTNFVDGHPDGWNQKLQEFIDLLGIDEYEIGGSVISSQMAVSYMAFADERLKKVTLSSPVVINTDQQTQYLTEILSPAARYVRLSAKFAQEIYRLWLKSVTLNLDEHYPSMLDQSVGSAEREMFTEHNMVPLLTDVFKEGARESLDGILSEMVFCLTPLNLDLGTLTTPLEVWYGTEDKRITQEGVETIFKEFPNCNLHIREGYSEHIYYALFEEIIA